MMNLERNGFLLVLLLHAWELVFIYEFSSAAQQSNSMAWLLPYLGLAWDWGTVGFLSIDYLGVLTPKIY